LHRPSATVLFRSVAAAYGARSVGILLTGMGDDGAAGLIEVKQAGGVTIAQDESTSVVFGMPAEAIRLGAADHILPPSEIVAMLVELSAARRSAA
jgi:two-component system chemotaxis response regulator CheB